jgi:hypothetical protein
MKIKKLGALIMALAMTLALAIPAFATDAPTRSITSTGANQLGLIDVTLGTDSGVTLNPYQMKATITPNGGTAQSSYHQVFFVPVKCTNKSTWGLKVNASITGAIVGGAAQFVTSVPKDNATTKDVFLYAEFGVSAKDEEPAWETAYTKAANQVLVGSEASAEKTVATLGAASSSKPNYLWYKFDGALTKSPETAWATGDKVNATIALTFIPTVDTVYAVTVTNTTSKTAGGTAKVNFDIAPAGETVKVTATPDGEINGGNSVPTVTVKTAAGATVEYNTDDNQFVMPASDVVVTVKWAAGS